MSINFRKINMITVNTYVVTERAVYEGVAQAISKLMSDPAAMTKPEAIVDGIAESVMSELCDVFDFGSQAVRFTPNLMAAMWAHAKAQAQADEMTPAAAADTTPTQEQA